MNKAIKTIAALTVLALPVAASAATISNEYVSHQYDPGELRAMAQGQDFKIVVLGNPTAQPQPAFEAQLMQILQDDMQGLATRPTTTPATTNGWGYRLVLLFNTGQSELGRTLCGNLANVAPPAAASGDLTVSAALCRGKDPLTVAFAHTGAASLNDPAAGQMFSELTSVLMPNRPGLMINRNIPF